MKSGVVSWWTDACLGCPQLLSHPERFQDVLRWLQTQLQRSAAGQMCRLRPDVHLQPDVCPLCRGGLTDCQGRDVRPFAATGNTTEAGRLGSFCEQTRHLPGTGKLEESVFRDAVWLGYLSTTRIPPQKSAETFLVHQ